MQPGICQSVEGLVYKERTSNGSHTLAGFKDESVQKGACNAVAGLAVHRRVAAWQDQACLQSEPSEAHEVSCIPSVLNDDAVTQ
jgi:hypothetical protein